MIRRLQSTFSSIHGLAIAGAWVFVVVSLMQLGGVALTKLAEPASVATLLETSARGVDHTAVGLTYDGVGGLFKAFFQLAVVGAAVFMTRLRFDRPRRIGHVALVAWAALWALNSHRLAGLDHEITSSLEAGLLTALFGCTVYRAGAGWRRAAPTIAVELVAAEVSLDEPPMDGPSEDETPMIDAPPAPRVRLARVRDAMRSAAARVPVSDATQRARDAIGRAAGFLRGKGAGVTKSA